MHCELVVPGLFAAANGVRLPAAELLVARGRESSGERLSLERWLFSAFGIAEDACPAGALSMLGHGMEPGDAVWARADPVHLRLMRERVVLVPAEAFGLAREEALELSAALNRHFDGRLALQVLEPHGWVARLTADTALSCETPLEMAGRDIAPRGAGDVLTNELQMALHAHPVNEAREARGEPPINSLWLWGAGKAADWPREGKARWRSLASAEAVSLGLARVANTRRTGLPESADAWLARGPEEGRHLAVLEGLRSPLALGDADACRERVQALEQAWLAPLLSALRGGKVGMVTLHVPDAGVSIEAIRGDLRRFWRRPRPISKMAP